MTTLVLGGTGFIGRRAVRRLAERGERVAVMDINPNAVSFAEFGDLVSVMRGDITEFEDVVKAVLASKPDRIMNLAYLLGSGDDTPHFTMKLNVLGMDNSFEAARVCGVDTGWSTPARWQSAGSRAPSATGWSMRTTRCTAPANTPCTRGSTSFRPSSSTVSTE